MKRDVLSVLFYVHCCVRGRPSGATGSTMHWIRWRFPCVTGQTTVCFLHQEKNTDKCRGNLRCSADGERGVLVELAKCHSPVVPLPPQIVFLSPLLTGLSRSVGGAFLRICTYRETPGALGPCTVPRTSHSPSSLRACHSGLHGTVRCFSNCTWADVMHCVSFRLRVASAQSFMNDDIILALCAFRFYVVSSASDCVIVLSRMLPSL